MAKLKVFSVIWDAIFLCITLSFAVGDFINGTRLFYISCLAVGVLSGDLMFESFESESCEAVCQ